MRSACLLARKSDAEVTLVTAAASSLGRSEDAVVRGHAGRMRPWDHQVMAIDVAAVRVEPSLNSLAAKATVNCLIGCAAGEITGMAIGTALGWSNIATLVLAVGLAFLFGYALTSVPLVRQG